MGAKKRGAIDEYMLYWNPQYLIENWEILVVTKYSDENTNEVYKSINSWEIYKWKIVILINLLKCWSILLKIF